jgi:hypothetical protein
MGSGRALLLFHILLERCRIERVVAQMAEATQLVPVLSWPMVDPSTAELILRDPLEQAIL